MKTLNTRLAFLFPLFFLFVTSAIATEIPAGLTQKAEALLQKQSFSFRKNEGQWKDDIYYQASFNGANINFLKSGLSFGFKRSVKKVSPLGSQTPEMDDQEYFIYNLSFLNSNLNSKFSTSGEHISNINYLKGEHKIVGAKDFQDLTYGELYSHIDLHYYAVNGKLKYDYLVKEEGNVNDIKMSFAGIKKLKITKKGELLVQTIWGDLIEKAPVSYQLVNGLKKNVKVDYYLINDSTFGFRVKEKYDLKNELVIDPVILEWSTFIGGPAPGGGYIYDIAIDNAGYIYATGWYETGFPTTPGAYSTTFTPGGSCGFGGGDEDAYVFKMTPDATSLVYCTYIGGTCKDRGRGIAINNLGEAFVTGWTYSVDFPTVNPFQATNAGSADVFALRLNPTGTALFYSTYIGGVYNDWAEKIAVNSSNEAYFCGSTLDLGTTPGFPTTAGSVQPGYGGGSYQADAYVVKLSSAGSSLLYSTYLGGPGWDWAYSIQLNAAGEAFVAGQGESGFPATAGSYQTTCAGASDVFISRINASGTAMIYSTFIGGASAENANSIAINAANEAFITGRTASANYPVTSGCYDPTFNGGTYGDVIVSKISAAGTSLLASTYIGTPALDIGWGIDVDANNNIFVAGYTDNAAFPTTACAYDQTYNGTSDADYFFLKLNASASSLKYSTLIGGNDQDYWEPKIKLIGTICDQRAICSGTSHSINFPTTAGVFQPVKLNGVDDQPTVLKWRPKINPGFTINPNPVCGSTPITFTDTTSQCGLWDTLTVHNWDFGDGATASGIVATHTYAGPGTYTVMLIVGCPMDTAYETVTVGAGITSTITSTNSSCGNPNGTATDTPTNGTAPYIYAWSNGGNTATITGLSSGTYSVTVTDNAGCSGTATVVVLSSGDSVVANFTGDTLMGCSPHTVNFTDQSFTSTGSIVSWSWLFGDGNTSSLQDPVNIYLNPGAYTVSLTVVNSNGCSSSFSIVNYVNVYPDPIASFTSNTNNATNSNPNVAFTDQSTNAYSWLWEFSGIDTSTFENPSYTFPYSGMWPVVLTVTNQYGCIDSVSEIISIKDEYTFYIPNAFTINGNGLNETFSGIGRGIAAYHMEIYDRWGMQLYVTDDYYKPWDGSTKWGKEKVQQDVYVYKMTVTDIFAKEHYYLGSVTVLK